jgi:hypothetical protein
MVYLVTAPCCGAPLKVRLRQVIMSEVDVCPETERKADDWNVPFDKNWRQRRMCEHCGEVVGHKRECVTQNPPGQL